MKRFICVCAFLALAGCASTTPAGSGRARPTDRRDEDQPQTFVEQTRARLKREEERRQYEERRDEYMNRQK